MVTSSKPVWLITGAAGILGAELVRQLTTTGADCIALDRNEKALNELHDGMVESGLSAPALLPLDLAGASPTDYAQVADRIDQQYGRLDGLIHNAADFKALRPLAHQPPDEWMKILQTGVTGPQFLTSAVLSLLNATEQSKLVFIEDSECLKNPANWAAYGVAQAGRQWMVKAMQREIGSAQPSVMTVDPGPFFSRLHVLAWPVAQPKEFDPIEVVAGRVLKTIIMNA